MTRTLVVVNPSASQVRDSRPRQTLIERIASTIERRDGSAPRIAETTSPSDVRHLVGSAVADGIGTVVGIGGDGTLRAIASSLAGTDVPLGIIPAGTGNQVAAVLGIPRSLDKAVDAMSDAVERTVDLGEVTVYRGDAATGDTATAPEVDTFIIGCGAGFDAELMATTPDDSKRRYGKGAYVAQAIRLGMGMKASPCRLTIDDNVIDTAASIAVVVNIGEVIPGWLGLRLPIVPDDGLLDVIVMGANSPLQGLLGLADQLTRSSLGGEDGAPSLRLRGRRIAVEFEAPTPMQIDGDYIGTGRFEARIRPAALRVLVPGEGY